MKNIISEPNSRQGDDIQDLLRKQKNETSVKTGEAKAIVADVGTLFKYFDKLKDLLPDLKDTADAQGSEGEKDVKEMLSLLVLIY